MRGILAFLCLAPVVAQCIDYHALLSAGLEASQTSASPIEESTIDAGKRRGRLVIKESGGLSRADGVISVTDGAAVSLDGRDFSATKIEIQEDNNQVTASGDVSIVGRGDDIAADRIVYSNTYRTWEFSEGEVTASSAWLGGQFSRPLYFQAQEAVGSDFRYRLWFCDVTSCEEDHPHYNFAAKRVTVIPNRHVTLHDMAIQVFGRTILGLPSFTIPLRQNNDRYLPEVGQSPDEGYYVKSRFGIPVRGDDSLNVLADGFTKLGVGVGLEYLTIFGLTKAYGLIGNAPSMTVSNNYNRGPLSGDFLYQKNQYTNAPETTLLQTRGAYRAGGFGASVFRTSTESGSFKSVSESVVLDDRRQWGNTSRRKGRATGDPLGTNIKLSYNRSNSEGFGTARESERLDVRFQADKAFGAFDTDLLYERSIPMVQSQNFLRTRDRTPQLTIKTDSSRLKMWNARSPWRVNFNTVAGEQIDPTSQRPITRYFFDVNAQGRTSLAQGLDLALTGQYQQGVYSDDTAQYVLRSDARLSYNLGNRLQANVSHRYLKPVGFTPISSDRTGRFDAMSFDINYSPDNRTKFGLQTGYDFLSAFRSQTPWQIVSLRGEHRGGNIFLRADAQYDTFSQVWSQIRLDSEIRYGDLRAVVGTRFDARRSTWAGLNVLVEGLKSGQTSLNFIIDYNGYTKQIDAQQYELVYDLHCVEAVLSVVDNRVGFRSGRQIGFFIRIKGLPQGDPFGVGRRGQSIFGLGG